jgi:hypothetical protein
MSRIVLTMVACVALVSCAATGETTAWAKPGVSRIDYGTDIGTCAGLASQQGGGSGVYTAGGVSGQNNSAPAHQPGRGTQQNGPGGGPPAQGEAAKSDSLPALGSYSGTVSQDYAQRAATQQRTQEMTARRARAETLRKCLSGRGYSEYTLTPEQRAHLATLKPGSDAYHEYLYKIGSDPATAGSAK